MKTEFNLMHTNRKIPSGFVFKIIGKAPKYKPYVSVDFGHTGSVYYIDDKDLERLAVNILKALNSKRLKP